MLIISIEIMKIIEERETEKKKEKNKVVMPSIVKWGELKSNLELVLSIILKGRELCIREFVY